MNFGTPVPLIVGVILIVGAIALFFLDKIKPGYRRDSDNVYAFLGLLAGVILLAHLGMEFTLSLQQMIVVGMLVALMIENIQNRLPNNGPMRQPRERGGYREDDYRPRRQQRSSRTRSEAQLEFEDDRPSRPRRIRGERERRSRRDEYAYNDSYDDSSYQRSRQRTAYDDYEQGNSSYSQDSYSQDSYSQDGYEQSYNSSPSSSPPETSTERPRRRRPLQLTGELEDQDYTPDDYSSAVKAMRNRRRKNTGDDSADDYSSDYSGDSNASDPYGQNGNGDYADYKPLDLPKYPGPDSGSEGPESDDGSY
ncbi:Ycf66 family protein [Acaryochloris sp. IP29b_bin.148]|uniref:Ycf66 family protein n=1 Tax=Acaryochloris sp. IP29b_bin.148 TaxID=2969218 RepID=UPI00262F85E7|nr:Ycf66 family protein [Acaryochloris sp. IP29b_bin.148]